MTDIHPNDLAEIASLLARGYLRYRDSLRRKLPNCLASGADTEPHVLVVNNAESYGEPANTVEEGRLRTIQFDCRSRKFSE